MDMTRQLFFYVKLEKKKKSYNTVCKVLGGGGLVRCIMGDAQEAKRTTITSVFKIVFCLPSWPQTCHKYRFGGRWDHRRTKRQQILRTERKNTVAKTI